MQIHQAIPFWFRANTYIVIVKGVFLYGIFIYSFFHHHHHLPPHQMFVFRVSIYNYFLRLFTSIPLREFVLGLCEQEI